MRDDYGSAAADRSASRAFDRRTMLAGTAGALLGSRLVWSPRAGAGAAWLESSADARIDPVLARQFQQALNQMVSSSKGMVPGAILYVERAGRGTWSGTAGLARLHPQVAMRPDTHFPAGSIAKTFVATAVLQLVERGRFALDAALPKVLPAEVTNRFPSAPKTTVRMLLSHRSGLPNWEVPAIDLIAARNQGRIWKVSEELDVAAGRKLDFQPGARYGYSNTNYTLLGLVIEHAAGHSWRKEVTDRIVRPLGLRGTVLRSPGNRSLPGPYAHGYMRLNGTVRDASHIDPSMAGPAGGYAVITTAHDLVRFLDALLAGRLFRRRETLNAMVAFKSAPDRESPGQTGYGLGLIHRAFPGGVETIDHYGGTVVYAAYVGRLTRQRATFAAAINGQVGAGQVVNASPLLFGVLRALATARG